MVIFIFPAIRSLAVKCAEGVRGHDSLPYRVSRSNKNKRLKSSGPSISAMLTLARPPPAKHAKIVNGFITSSLSDPRADKKQIPVLPMRQTLDFDPMLFQCWASVFDAGPTLRQHWVYVSRLLHKRPEGLPAKKKQKSIKLSLTCQKNCHKVLLHIRSYSRCGILKLLVPQIMCYVSLNKFVCILKANSTNGGY